jgi:O-antigen/teichoic acid export membrane protein
MAKQISSKQDDARELAGDSLLSLSGAVAGRVAGLATTWLLAWTLGAADYGLYVLGATLVLFGASMGTLGGDSAAAFYTARHREDVAPSPLRGMLRGALLLAATGGTLLACIAWGLALFHSSWSPEHRTVAAWVGAGIAVGSLSSVAARTLVGGRDVRGFWSVQQVGQPLLTLIGCAAAMALGWGVTGALGALVLARILTLLRGALRVRVLLGERLAQESGSRTRWPTLLAFSLPQSLTGLLHRSLLSADLLMLSALATFTDVGIYRVAMALAMLGTIPLIAANNVFGPRAARWLHKGEFEVLADQLHRMTRWLVIAAAPLFLVTLLLPDLLVQIFSDEYRSAATVLAILIAGKAIQVLLEPAGACLVQGGHAGLNLGIGVAAVTLNLALNWHWIPLWGITGAALASSLAIATWSTGRAFLVWRFFGLTPMSRANTGMLLVLGLASLVTWHGGESASVSLRIAATAALVGAGTWATWRITSDNADRTLLQEVTLSLLQR